MNHYPRHLGDYATGTLGFNQGEHGAYGLLMDAYYASEQALPAEDVHAIGKATTPLERKAVDKVLARKFELRDGRYYHKRIEAELDAYRVRAETARVNGRGGGRKPSKNQSGNPVGSFPDSQSEPSEKLASSHKPVINPNPEKHSLGIGDIPAPPERVAALSALCVQARVETDARAQLHIRQWAAEGVTDQQLRDAIAIAQIQKIPPAVIPARYLAAIVPDVVSGKRGSPAVQQSEVIARTIARINADEAGNASH